MKRAIADKGVHIREERFKRQLGCIEVAGWLVLDIILGGISRHVVFVHLDNVALRIDEESQSRVTLTLC